GGRTVPAALSEVREAVDFLRYYAARARAEFAMPQRLPGPTGEQDEIGLHGRGVFACISPWNFPLSIFTGQIAAALAAGNAVIAKAAEQTPLVAAAAVRHLLAAGIPGDVLHLLPGDGETVGAALVADPRIAGVAFTGSASARTARRRHGARGPAPLPMPAARQRRAWHLFRAARFRDRQRRPARARGVWPDSACRPVARRPAGRGLRRDRRDRLCPNPRYSQPDRRNRPACPEPARGRQHLCQPHDDRRGCRGAALWRGAAQRHRAKGRRAALSAPLRGRADRLDRYDRRRWQCEPAVARRGRVSGRWARNRREPRLFYSTLNRRRHPGRLATPGNPPEAPLSDHCMACPSALGLCLSVAQMPRPILRIPPVLPPNCCTNVAVIRIS